MSEEFDIKSDTLRPGQALRQASCRAGQSESQTTLVQHHTQHQNMPFRHDLLYLGPGCPTFHGFEGLKIPALAVFCLVVGLPCVVWIPKCQQPGLYRFLMFSPVLIMHLILPLVFSCEDEVVERASALFLLSWLANFKIIAVCMDRGPLASSSWTPLQTLFILYLPIYPSPPTAENQSLKKKGRLQDSSGSSSALLVQWVAKIVLLSVLVYLLSKGNLSPIAKDLLYPWAIYCFLGLLMDGPAALVLSLIGVLILPTFDQPWLSTSLSDFWGRRWNITTSHMLRVIVYDPIAEGRLIKKRNGEKFSSVNAYGRLAGLLATFLMSGLIHEYIFWLLQSDGLLTLKWLAFFTVQGPLMMVEWKLHEVAVKTGWQARTLVSRAVTLALLLLIAHFWFWPPCTMDSDLADRVVRQVMSCLDRVLVYMK